MTANSASISFQTSTSFLSLSSSSVPIINSLNAWLPSFSVCLSACSIAWQRFWFTWSSPLNPASTTLLPYPNSRFEMSAELPSPEVRATIIERLSELIIAIEAHPAWNPENPHRGLFHVWDFVSRSRYIMTELDHIRDGEPVQYPEQIRQQSG